MVKGAITPGELLEAEVLQLGPTVAELFWREIVVARGTPPLEERSTLIGALEHAAHPRCRKEALPELFLPDLSREHAQGLRRSGERLPRFSGLPTPLAKLADSALDLPEFLG